MQKLTLALDWTPNINHIGFFVAQENGFYDEEKIDLNILDPSSDEYQITPAKKVEKGIADFALCPTESLLSYRTKSQPFPLLAIAAILQDDLSAIVVKKDKNIDSPKNLDGRTYASYQAKYEDEIVKQMIINDGGKGDIEVIYPEKLGIWKTVLNNSFDATWIFMNWEGIQINDVKEQFNFFYLSDFKIPYSYSPVLVANEQLITAKNDAYTRFLKATKKGYLFAANNQKASADILAKFIPEKDQSINLLSALEVTAKSFGDENSWGTLDNKVIETFLNWIYNKGLETQKIMAKDIYTNSLLRP